ncbi:hypothetical protein [Pengzhenrongella frigida]|uniref:Uncharacterized protein n=1 Tax=Pengzhenrongella frigida TaxID=1259133 RepID=A0A4Q5MUV1_9MICO|nr:hypothetical protein [Cellulomonas sp. HLT2-17]RYV49318.1 hypothetical protein EUA98_19445 [Cellulomonas sp. HLT2-17]
MSQLDAFESRLLAELRTVVDQDRKQPVVPAGHRAGRRGHWAIAAATAAAIAGAVVLVPTLQADPAWAVSRSGNDQVDVQVNRIEDADGLERALAGEGISADVSFVPDGGQCAPGRYANLLEPSRGFRVQAGSDRSFRVTVPPGAVPDGAVLVVAASLISLPDVQHDDGTIETSRTRVWVDVGVASGPVDPCVVVPAQD